MEKSTKSSSELRCCRGCLATDVKLFDIHKNQLAEAFGYITGYPVVPQDGFPQWLCGVCRVLLAKSTAFRERCRRAHDCFLQTLDHKTMEYIETIDRFSNNLVFQLSQTHVEVTDMSICPLELKDEPSVVVNETIFKDELDAFGLDIDEDSSPIDDRESIDDNTDEVKEIGNKIKIEQVLIPTDKVEVKRRPTRKRKVELKNKKQELKERRLLAPSPTEFQPNFDVAALEKELNVDIEILNKEQQLADWRQFSASKKTPAAFPCQVCGKGFDHPTPYKNHLLRHSPSAGRFECEVCGVRFRRRSQRRLHRRRHALRFVCRDCKFVTRDKNQAKLHLGSHEGHKFQCKHCEKNFVKRSSYLSHVRLAHAAENVPCGECGETFVSPLGLTHHYSKTHKAQKAASKCACASCGAAFDSADALHAHEAIGRCDPEARPCAACGASLATDEALRTHTEECHKEEFKCTECPLLFAGDGPRETHYWRVHALVRARQRPPRRPPRPASRVCPHCGRLCQNSSLLEEHLRIHTGEKPYACADCALRFNCRANLQRHHRVVSTEALRYLHTGRAVRVRGLRAAVQLPRQPAAAPPRGAPRAASDGEVRRVRQAAGFRLARHTRQVRAPQDAAEAAPQEHASGLYTLMLRNNMAWCVADVSRTLPSGPERRLRRTTHMQTKYL